MRAVLALAVFCLLAQACSEGAAPSPASAKCGDGVRQEGEACDGADLNNADCATAGTVTCTASCTLDFTGCQTQDYCGNATVDAFEECDGAELVGETCLTLGFDGGTLSCNPTTCSFDASACEAVPTCGNAHLDLGEACDGFFLAGQDCATQGFASGRLACADCQFDTSACSYEPGPIVTTCRTLAPLEAGTCSVTPGSPTQLITGDVLTPGRVLLGGQVLVDASGSISCVACDCAADASGATEISCPEGVVSPGLISAHEHLTYSHNSPVADAQERFEQRHDWRRALRGHLVLPVPAGATGDELTWSELRFVMGGATSAVSAGYAPGLLRNLDHPSGVVGLASSDVQTELFPLDDSSGQQRSTDCNYGNAATTQVPDAGAYLAHVGEGVDDVAHNEFRCTSSATYDTSLPGQSPDH